MIGLGCGEILALFDDGGQPIAVALGRQLSVELRNEQAAVREDEDAHRSRGFDKPGGSDRLARSGRVTEPVTPHRARILGGRELFGQKLQLFVG